MKKHTDLMEPDLFYHIFNRGVNGENIFKELSNYELFLTKYGTYIELIAETYAYCLLKNHFHFCIKTRTEAQIRQNLIKFEIDKIESKIGKNFDEALLESIKTKVNEKHISWLIGNVFSSFFKSYTQTVNFTYKRTGGLFEDVFRRIEINNDAYFTELIYYIHRNPEKHNFVSDFKAYPHSSYKSLLSKGLTKLKRDEVWKWFGNKNEFEKYHIGNQKLENLDQFELE